MECMNHPGVPADETGADYGPPLCHQCAAEYGLPAPTEAGPGSGNGVWRDQEAERRIQELLDEANRLGPERCVELCEQRRLAAAAGELAAGRHSLTVVHGDLETQADADRYEALHHAFAEFAGERYHRTQGGNDVTTFTVGPPAAAPVVDALARRAHELNPGWWEIAQCTA